MIKHTTHKTNKGFTVVEMIIAISIVSILTSIVLFNYQGFQRGVDFSNTAQEIALIIKKAQSESLAGKYPSVGNGQTYVDPTTWKPSYGVFFDKGSATMTYFFDRNNDGQFQNYDEKCKMGISECLEKITLGQSRTFSRICVYSDENLSDKDCDSGNISFVFKRPFPDTIIRYKYDPTIIDVGNTSPGPATIVVSDPQVTPNVYSISISVLGRLSLKNEPSIAPF